MLNEAQLGSAPSAELYPKQLWLSAMGPAGADTCLILIENQAVYRIVNISTQLQPTCL